MNRPKALAQSKWNEGHEKETMCLHKGGISYDAMIRNGKNGIYSFIGRAQDLERRSKCADKKQNLERLKPNLERRSKSS